MSCGGNEQRERMIQREEKDMAGNSYSITQKHAPPMWETRVAMGEA